MQLQVKLLQQSILDFLIEDVLELSLSEFCISYKYYEHFPSTLLDSFIKRAFLKLKVTLFTGEKKISFILMNMP